MTHKLKRRSRWRLRDPAVFRRVLRLLRSMLESAVDPRQKRSRVARRCLRWFESVDDCLHDCLLRMWEHPYPREYGLRPACWRAIHDVDKACRMQHRLALEYRDPRDLPEPTTEHPTDVLAQIEHALLRSSLAAAMRGLTYREREVLRLSYGLGDGWEYTLDKISRIFKFRRERGRQIAASGLRRLRTFAFLGPLRLYAPDTAEPRIILPGEQPESAADAEFLAYALSRPGRDTDYWNWKVNDLRGPWRQSRQRSQDLAEAFLQAWGRRNDLQVRFSEQGDLLLTPLPYNHWSVRLEFPIRLSDLYGTCVELQRRGRWTTR